jgi:hypothetical protein
LDYLATTAAEKIVVITTKNNKKKELEAYVNNSVQIVINRTRGIVPKSGFRLFQYLLFYLNSLRLLVKHRPQSILYFDTISSWPALVYKKLRGSKLKLLAHYHEYLTPQEYAHNMFLVKAMHRQETKMYPDSFAWISQTNGVRLQKMIADNRLETAKKSLFHSLPNYPSKYWATRKTDFGSAGKTRLVYVGALGYDSMYLKEIVQLVIKNQDLFTLDFYSFNIDDKAKEFLRSLCCDCIQYHGGVNYKELPRLLPAYDVGLVLYRPVSDNWIYNAPNKVFEYLACGLDVWFSKTMTYTLSLAREDAYPKIVAVDFENLDAFNIEKVLSREGLEGKDAQYFYEDEYSELYYALTQ